ncbi:MAG: hypothetical protein AAB676_08200 [Verrucomicrobiota bacterium]
MSDIVQKLWGFSHTLRHDGAAFPQPRGRKKIAQPFIAGFSGGAGTSPVRDGRNEGSCHGILSPLRGFGVLGDRLPTVETVGYYRPSRRD